jgi:hypothetical protein
MDGLVEKWDVFDVIVHENGNSVEKVREKAWVVHEIGNLVEKISLNYVHTKRRYDMRASNGARNRCNFRDQGQWS